MKKRTFKIITLGCKVNQYESAALKESLLGLGCSEMTHGGEADLAIINTCIVTQNASNQSRQAIRKALRENPSGITAAIGCYAQVYPKELADIEGIHLIAGNTLKDRLPEILSVSAGSDTHHLLSEDFKTDMPFQYLPMKGFLDRTRAFLKIQDGCRSFCSYCIVPLARGPLRSLESASVIRALHSLSEEGYKEVVLTGIHLGKYGVDLEDGIDLKGLLRLIGQEGFPFRIRLSSIEPNEIDRELVEMMVSEDRLCRHFHIPLQSGDDGILKKMNRTYTANEFAGLIDVIHRAMPLAAIGVDTIAGFPGEDDRAFKNTVNLLQTLPVSYLHVFPFSPRKGTPAAKFAGRLDGTVIKDRAGELRDLGRRKRKAFYRSCIGKTFSVLTEGWQSEIQKTIKGLSDNYLPVTFHSPRLIENKLVTIRMERVGEDGLIGLIQG
jgi:threonylcarbamoyladenosine tRNA methylthiotransferase MtaB